jgi:hypothetical protein
MSPVDAAAYRTCRPPSRRCTGRESSQQSSVPLRTEAPSVDTRHRGKSGRAAAATARRCCGGRTVRKQFKLNSTGSCAADSDIEEHDGVGHLSLPEQQQPGRQEAC